MIHDLCVSFQLHGFQIICFILDFGTKRRIIVFISCNWWTMHQFKQLLLDPAMLCSDCHKDTNLALN